MVGVDKQPSREVPPPKKGFKEKFKNSLKDFQSNENMGRMMSGANENTRDTISYIILIIGIILLFYNPNYGGLLVGLVAGFYFSSEILALRKNLKEFIEDSGIVKSLIGFGFILALFILAPMVFIGLILAVATRLVLFPDPKM